MLDTAQTSPPFSEHDEAELLALRTTNAHLNVSFEIAAQKEKEVAAEAARQAQTVEELGLRLERQALQLEHQELTIKEATESLASSQKVAAKVEDLKALLELQLAETRKQAGAAADSGQAVKQFSAQIAVLNQTIERLTADNTHLSHSVHQLKSTSSQYQVDCDAWQGRYEEQASQKKDVLQLKTEATEAWKLSEAKREALNERVYKLLDDNSTLSAKLEAQKTLT
jgi:hypothetical protein